MPRSTESWRIGPEKFARKLDLELDAGLTADEVLREAEAEASRVEREMAVIARQMWGTTFPGEPIPPDDAEGRRTMIRRVLAAVARDHGTPATLVADTRATVGTIKEFITAQDDPPPARARPVPVHRDARVHAGQLGGLPEPGAAARPARLERVRDQPAAGRLAAASGSPASSRNTTGRCSRS